MGLSVAMPAILPVALTAIPSTILPVVVLPFAMMTATPSSWTIAVVAMFIAKSTGTACHAPHEEAKEFHECKEQEDKEANAEDCAKDGADPA